MTTKPTRALILVSVSTPEQALDKKQSLRTQERDLRALADERDWQVVNVLKIPGFSRDYISWDECERDMLAATPPITAMRDLRLMTERRAYDVFMVRDADRFGRTQSLIMQIAETICIRQRLKIYSQIDNTLVEGEAARFWAAMTGLRSAGEMDKKRIYHDNGMDERAKSGFYESRTAWYHRTVFDPDSGEALRVEVREEYRYIWDAVYDMLVNRRVGFPKCEIRLNEDYHIVDPLTDKPFKPYSIHRFMYASPGFWGHRARKVRPRRGEIHSGFGVWTFDAHCDPPEGVRVWRDVFPPVYTGEQAERLKSELYRRKEMRGGRKPDYLSPFAGLVVCDYCHFSMIYQQHRGRNWEAYRCITNDRAWEGRPHCGATHKSIQVHIVRDFLDDLLRQCLADGNLQHLFPLDNKADAAAELSRLDEQIGATQLEARRLVDRLSLVPDELLNMHRDKMRAVHDKLKALMSRQEKLRAEVQHPNRAEQERALQDIAAIGLSQFWREPHAVIQQSLHRLLAGHRIVVADGEPIRIL